MKSMLKLKPLIVEELKCDCTFNFSISQFALKLKPRCVFLWENKTERRKKGNNVFMTDPHIKCRNFNTFIVFVLPEAEICGKGYPFSRIVVASFRVAISCYFWKRYIHVITGPWSVFREWILKKTNKQILPFGRKYLSLKIRNT